MKPLAPKTTLQDRYQITQLIGKGGMGEVYLAIDQRLGHSVALKRTTVGDDVLLTEAFEREARTLAQLRHSVLPKVSDHFVENDEQFLVMDYISGEDLAERLKSTNKPFPLNWVMFWADQLLEALTYLHTHNPPIIHRDIKPQNLKLTDDNNIVLLDFGLSKNALNQTKVTTSGSVVGYTPHYAPMEQIRGTGTNAVSDIFSLSATLYQLLSNEVPPDALTRADAMLSNLPDPLIPLTKLNPEISETISDVILKGMEISQNKRFESAREMQKVLRREYNAMQTFMSAQTVAFNVQDEELSGNGDIPLNEDFSGDKTEVIDASEMQNFIVAESPDATVQFQSDVTENYSDEPVGLKTEVIPNEQLPDNIANDNLVTNENIPSAAPFDNEFKTSDDISESNDFSTNDFKTNENIIENSDALPEATVPLILLEDQTSTTDQYEESIENETDTDSEWSDDFDSGELSEDNIEPNEVSSATVSFDNTENFSAEHKESYQTETNAVVSQTAVAEEPKVQTEPQKEKSSTGKYIAILGGLGAILVILLGSALAIGLYYNGTFSSGNDNSTVTTEPTPQVTPEVTPNVETNPLITDTDNTNSENTNSEDTSLADNDLGNSNTNSENSDVTSSDSTTVTTTKNDKTDSRSTTKSQTTKPPVRTTTKPPVDRTKKTPVDNTKKVPTPKPKQKVKDPGVL